MFNPRIIFHKISYLAYPVMLVALFYVFKPYFVGFDTIWENYNYALIFLGLGVSLATLQDTTKTQNNFSKRIWESPKKGKYVLIGIAFLCLYFVVAGIYGFYISTNEIVQQLSFGAFVLGIGIMGMLKSAIEMFENHRLDKKI